MLLIPTALGIRPSNTETSAPAYTNLKILSINKRTSFPSSSLKYSATVTAVKPN